MQIGRFNKARFNKARINSLGEVDAWPVWRSFAQLSVAESTGSVEVRAEVSATVSVGVTNNVATISTGDTHNANI